MATFLIGSVLFAAGAAVLAFGLLAGGRGRHTSCGRDAGCGSPCGRPRAEKEE